VSPKRASEAVTLQKLSGRSNRNATRTKIQAAEAATDPSNVRREVLASSARSTR